jgi:hypothetical protein
MAKAEIVTTEQVVLTMSKEDAAALVSLVGATNAALYDYAGIYESLAGVVYGRIFSSDEIRRIFEYALR